MAIAGRKTWVFWIIRRVARVLLSPFFCLEISGAENLPKKTAFILLSKHQRWEDIPLLGLATPRPLYYVAKHELFKNPLSNWFIKSLGGIPLNRQRPVASRRSLQAIIEFLKRGEGVVVFPEGTYYRKRMGPGHVGIVKLILGRVSFPFLPVGINYSEGVWRTLVRISFGKPIFAGSGETQEEFLNRIMKDIAVLSGLS